MAHRISQGLRSNKILLMLRNEDEYNNILSDNIPKDKEPQSSPVTQNISSDSTIKQIILDSQECALLEKLNTFNSLFKDPKSLSLNDLTQDTEITLHPKRSLSAPLINDILYRSVSLSLPIDFYAYDDYEPESQNVIIDNEVTDCKTSEDEYGDINEGRKRRRTAKKKEWKKQKAQKMRMLGEEYLGYSKPRNEKMRQDQMRPAKELGETCQSEFCKKSKFRGCNSFDEETRKALHTYFWKKLNWDERKIFVKGLVNRSSTTQKTKGEEHSRREGTLNYFLPKKDKEGKIQVCKLMFLNTLSLKSTTVQMWAKKDAFNEGITSEDNSQKNNTPGNAKLLALKNYFKSIPKMPSHYARKETRKLYLEPVYRSVSDIFNSYKRYCTENDIPAVSRFTFDKEFNHQNLALYTLKKDMCDICVGHKEGNVDDHLYQEHLIKKNRAREEKDRDKENAVLGQCILLAMDLEAVKVCPYSTASAFYFKTKLTCHNFTIFNLTSHHCTCYWFTETVADLTASTFSSFLIDYIERHCLSQKLPIIIYSDGCTYQNRNVVMANALLNLSFKHKINITQKFLERGHTQMECDSVHSAIERKLTNREIHLPCDYVSVTKEARLSNPYEVIQIDHNFVKNYADTCSWLYKSIRPGRKAGDPTVTDIRAILYNQENTIKVKLYFDQDWFPLPQRTKNFNPNISYSSLYTSMIPISASKYQHLQELKQILPSECHNYYDTLPHL